MITIFLFASAVITSCGGGGGGGGLVAFAPSEGGTAAPHNGGDASGWGTGTQTGSGFNPEGQSIEESESGPLFSQMAALDVSTVDIRLNINNVEQPLIVANETTPKSVLPKIKPGTKVHGSAVIHLQDGTARTAYLDETEAELHGVLKFKVPYNFKAYDLSGTLVKEDTYFARDGINLAAQTVDPIAGWQCVEDGTTHYGSYVASVRGDITLNAVASDDAPILRATSSTDVLFARATSADTATITITNVTGTPQIVSISSLLDSGTFVRDSTDETKYTLTINIKTSTNPQTAAVMPVWFTDSAPANITITDDSGIQASVPLTLKNKYSYQLQTVGTEWTDDPTLISTYDFTTTAVEIEQGGTLTFAAAAAELNGHYPTDREIVSFYYNDMVTAYYNKSPTPATITFSSASFTSRNVLLKALPDLKISRAINNGGYAGTTPQDGSSTRPYLLNYYGTATQRKIQIEIYDNICNNGNLTLEPDPSQHTNIDTIMSTMFNKTHDDNKFTYELKSDLAKSNVYTDLIKLIATDPTTGATKDVWIRVVKVGIGNKDTPNAIGDIVFTDGTAMAYTDFNSLDAATKNEKKAAAIALIFYKGSSSDALGARTLGVGLKHYKYGHAWCPSSAAAYNKNIDTIQCIPSGSAGAYTFSGDKDGSDNLSQIATFLENNASTNDTGTAANYRAFYFAKNYASQTVTNIDPASEYASYWYLPSIAELFQIYANGKGANKIFDIDAASNALGGDSFGTSSYWSSSQSAAGDVYAYDLSFNDGNYTGYNKTQDNDVCAIRAF